MIDFTRTAASPPVGASELFQILRDGVPRTRAELAALTGLARSTIAVRLDALVDVGLVGPVETAASTGGRPPAQVALVPRARLVVAADLGASHGRVAVTDLVGAPLATREAAIDIAAGPVPTLTWLVETVDELLDEVGRRRDDVVAIGIGVPGPVEFSTGRPANPPIMPGWDGFDVPGWLRGHVAAHVLVDNDVNIAALGERAYGWPDLDHLLFVKVATGIGSGIVSDGQLRRGAQGTAGDIGHVRVSRAGDVPCHCGNTGCLEAVASGPAIARALRAKGHDVHTSGDVIDLVNRSELDAIGAVRQAGRDIGEVLATCVSLVNPSVITLGGSITRAGEHLLAGVREVVYARSMPLATEHLVIAQSRAGSVAALQGAAVLALDYALSPAGVDELVAPAEGRQLVS
ncbi:MULTISPECIES: ROK family transcriptional regulator [unclassified Curtobacterium]|uniref:ROK family transcriptional regulator n=1 Tax=unclassified Curtobacterium TaxID=257496 RepID=UPI00052AF34C|nr:MULTISPECIES: ROK family transcriptional regulator [unclassified Curtobacterium]AIV40540.1 ROK family transcriptional regulator [Curtobacterium sp. MR_MD2014]MBP1302292.1 putative NBD/HSP70 family sugar kinase [Curtobacterium sp. 1310]MCM3520196.1 ROK family transcriptional regulator [Curtobacterium sp. P97]MDB6425628.1 ROK family transcriptional regulator [Curtobacterium sp. 20TX0008]MDP9735313.1 putative NBD/HSP70 family sugar kinase [Curtobacterium sp. 260]